MVAMSHKRLDPNSYKRKVNSHIKERSKKGLDDISRHSNYTRSLLKFYMCMIKAKEIEG